MTKIKPGVKYINSILKEVAEEQGRDYKEVKEAWKLHIQYIKTLIDSGEVDVIELPKIGNLFFNMFTYNTFSKRTRAKIYEKQVAQRDRVKKLVEKDIGTDRKTLYLYPQIRRSSIYNLYRAIRMSIDKKRISYSTLAKVIKRVEEYSTNMFRKK